METGYAYSQYLVFVITELFPKNKFFGCKTKYWRFRDAGLTVRTKTDWEKRKDMAQSSNYIAILKDALYKKQNALELILKITKAQEVLSKHSSYQEQEMERLLNEKEMQIARINTLDEGFQSIYDRVRVEVKDHPEQYAEEVKQLQDLIRVCTDLGNEIMVLEERNRERFSVLFSNAKSQYTVSKTKANVAQHYHKTMNNTKIMDAYFVDKKQ